MLELLIKVLLSYLVGSVIGSLVVGRLSGGVDIRSEGSGNAGGTNAFRSRGWAFAIPAVLIDAGKGVLAVLFIARLPLPFVPEALFHPMWIAVACGAAAIVGHVWPIWHGFRGGKGMATYLGVLGALAWPVLAMALLVWVIVLILTGYVSLATMLAAAAVAIYALLITGFGPLFMFGILMAAFIVFTHRSNLTRLSEGTEYRFEKAMLLKRLLGGLIDVQATRQRLLALLADGGIHSGEALGDALGISRAAVWKQVVALDELGLEVSRMPGQGYRLAQPLELLDAERILTHLSPAARQRLALQVHDVIDSTNAQLMREIDLASDVPVACLAEQQTAGRGRRGRPWISPFGANLYLSLSWPFERLPPDFPALGLAAGVAARRALVDLGFTQVRLKWPNDLHANGAKLGGILLEMRGEPPGPCRVVAGIGINVRMPPAAAGEVDQAWIDLARFASVPPSRNVLAAAMLERWMEAFDTFAESGFTSFLGEWRAADLLAGRAVTVIDGSRHWSGTARGVTADGALEVETTDVVRRFVAGEVSLREAQ